MDDVLQLQGWTRRRRVVVLRRALPQDVAMVDKGTESRQERFVGMVVMNPAKPMYESDVGDDGTGTGRAERGVTVPGSRGRRERSR